MFDIKAGKSQRELVYDAVSGAEVGHLFTLDELGEQTEVDLTVNRGPLYAAIKLLEEREHHTLIAVRGRGYQVAAAVEHLDQARKRQTRARRQIGKGCHTLAATKVTELTPLQVAEYERLTTRMDGLQTQLRKVDRRVAVLEQAQEVQAVADADRDAKIARLERELMAARRDSDL